MQSEPGQLQWQDAGLHRCGGVLTGETSHLALVHPADRLQGAFPLAEVQTAL